MTHEEAKKMGATHYIDMHGITYHKCESGIWYFWDCVFSNWEYMHSTWAHRLKPL